MTGPVLCAVMFTVVNSNSPTPSRGANWSDYAPCGQVSLFLVAKMHGRDVTWKTARDAVGDLGPDGVNTFAELTHAAHQIGLHPVAVEVRPEHIANLPCPAIVQTVSYHGDPNPHFSVLVSVLPDGVVLLDAPRAPLYFSAKKFAQIWSGRVLLLFPDAGAAARYQESATPGGWRELWLSWAARFAWLAFGLGVVTVGVRYAWMRSTTASDPAGPFRLTFRMRLLILAGTLIGLAALGTAWPTFTAWSPAAQLRFDPWKDVGVLTPGMHEIEFPVHNPGRLPLRVTKVTTTCQCVTVVPPEPVEPGQSRNLTLQVDPPPGPRTVDLVFHSNDPSGPKRLTVQLAGTTRPVLRPEVLYFDCDGSGRPVEQDIRVYFAGGPNLVPELGRADCEGGLVTFTPQPGSPATELYGVAPGVNSLVTYATVRATLAPLELTAPRRVMAHLTFKLGGSEYDHVVPVYMQPKSALEFDQHGIIFQANGTGGIDRNRVVKLRNGRAGQQFVIRQTPDWCRCAIETDAEGNPSLRIELRDPPNGAVTADQVIVADSADPGCRAIVNVCVVGT